ncbi:MAG: hypothetical protein QNJ31_03335 [Candidatus Caenarcaniphilales bacterium]|nr:hypothetical protein [Candidatus Caenarcaniphilales bacterium]
MVGNRTESVVGASTNNFQFSNGGKVQRHANLISKASLSLLPEHKDQIKEFQSIYRENQSLYREVEQKTQIPSVLIAALHFRESKGNFRTYLHQGDPLGRAPVNHPTNIPTFHNWTDSAIHALGMKKSTQNKLGINASTNDLSLLAEYAETYNGKGYENRGLVTPYVYSGTSVYSGGKFVADGKFNSSTIDKQVGILPLIMSVSNGDFKNLAGNTNSTLNSQNQDSFSSTLSQVRFEQPTLNTNGFNQPASA